VRALVEAGVAVVCGTTGWRPEADLAAAVERSGVGVVVAPNFSVGAQAFLRIVERAARLLAASGMFDPFIQEQHHRAKRDAPSGTARRLAAILIAADSRRARIVESGLEATVAGDAIQVSSVRAGHEPGTHTVGFDGEHERITLEHRARGRDGFAVGAVLASEWIVGRRGLHEFEDVVDAWLGREGEERS
jgi:4-hydroxy-tetrahydrodipicolinate reductase